MNIISTDEYDFGFRPEKFLPKTIADNVENTHMMQFHVKRVEYLGADRLVYGNVEGHEDKLTLSRIPSNVNVPLEVDENYAFAVPKEAMKYFDKTSGERIATQVNEGVAV